MAAWLFELELVLDFAPAAVARTKAVVSQQPPCGMVFDSVVAVRSARPLACAHWIVRPARVVPMPILWNASATSIASSATSGRAELRT